MKRVALLAALIAVPLYAAEKPVLKSGRVYIEPCPVCQICAPAPVTEEVCRDIIIERDHLQTILTTPRECPSELPRGSLQPDSDLGNSGIELGRDPDSILAELPAPQKVVSSDRGWKRFWIGIAVGSVTALILENQWDDDEVVHHHHEHNHEVEPPKPDWCWPPGLCKE
jgi:hypothetical protein